MDKSLTLDPDETKLVGNYEKTNAFVDLSDWYQYTLDIWVDNMATIRKNFFKYNYDMPCHQQNIGVRN